MARNEIPTTEQVSSALTLYQDTGYAVIPVDSNESYEAAALELRRVKARHSELEELRKTMTRPLDAAKRAILDLFDPVTYQYETIERGLKQAMNNYTAAQERERRRVEAELRDEAAAEAVRIEAEAAKLRKKGKVEAADYLLESVPAPPVVLSDRPKARGIITSTRWSGEVTDMGEFLTYVLQTERYDLVEANTSALNTLARELHGAMPVPGVRWVETPGIAVRAS